MAYDSPKAAHFPLVNGKGEVLPNHPASLVLRWNVAIKVSREFSNLLGLTEKQIERVNEIIDQYNFECKFLPDGYKLKFIY